MFYSECKKLLQDGEVFLNQVLYHQDFTKLGQGLDYAIPFSRALSEVKGRTTNRKLARQGPVMRAPYGKFYSRKQTHRICIYHVNKFSYL